jgi:hypothetical protein
VAASASASPVSEVVDVSDVSPVAELRLQPKHPNPPARRAPPKVDAELLQQMRNLTAFIRGRGHPMVEFGELLDEALSDYLGLQRRELNEGESFPNVGSTWSYPHMRRMLPENGGNGRPRDA